MNTDNLTLPELSAARIDELEDAVFDRIARDRRAAEEADRRRRARRGRWWAAGGAAAAVIVVAAAIAPSVLGSITGTAGSGSEQALVAPASRDAGAAEGPTAFDAAAGTSAESLKALTPDTGRDVITTASATVEVDELPPAIEAITAAAQSAGGYVESLSTEGTGAGSNGSASDGAVSPDVYYPGLTGTWITVRVPADRLDAVTKGLSEIGTVAASRLDRADVTTATVDLRARVAALEASVARLTGLMAEATSTGDLIAAESALAQRQGELESYRQQLQGLEGQVAMSTLTVTLVTPAETVKADPAGFGDGIAAGWNGLVATLNGIVVGVGFLLPWIAVLGVIGLALWGIRRVVRRRRARRTVDAGTPADDAAL